MTVALGMIFRNEEPPLPRLVDSARDLVDEIVAVDTGSEDGTVALLEREGAHVTQVEWTDFSAARNRVMDEAADRCDWLLMVDADSTVEFHPGLKDWLGEDTSPDTDAWMVERVATNMTWRVPALTRASTPWRYTEPVHEYLVCPEEKRRPLLGLSLIHHGDDGREGKYLEYIDLLKPLADQGDPRALYYLAQSYWCMGVNTEAARLFAKRAVMANTWEEERWHAGYMAARISRDIEGLLAAYQERPWRPEPLEWAARLTRELGPMDDVLFLETSAPSERMPSCR